MPLSSNKIIKYLITSSLFVGCTYQQTFPKKNENPHHPLAIIQGLTGSHETQISVLGNKNTNYSYYFAPIQKEGKNKQPPKDKVGENEKILKKQARHTRKFSFYSIDEIHITSLQPQKKYWFLVRDSKNHLVDLREFQSLDVSLKNPTIAIASCMSDAPAYQKVGDQMWTELYNSQPHVLFLIGDTVYVDVDKNGKRFKDKISPPKRLWNRYVETRNSLKLFRMKKLIPILAVWDDHDYGINNGGKDYPYKNQAKDVFKQFFPRTFLPQSGLEQGPGVAFFWQAFGQGFIFADDRSFRTAKKKKTGTHWGKEQKDWIIQKLQNNLNSYWLINGGQFWGAYHRWESYEGHHPDSFKSFINDLGKHSKKPVWFVSGDRHLAELQIIKDALPYTSYELTTSSIHASVSRSFTWKKYPNPRKIEGVSGHYNYAVVKSSSSPQGQMDLEITVYGLNKRILFQRNLSVSTEK